MVLVVLNKGSFSRDGHGDTNSSMRNPDGARSKGGSTQLSEESLYFFAICVKNHISLCVFSKTNPQ